MDYRTLSEPDFLAYQHHLLQEERAPATVEKYLRDIRAFAAWLNGQPVTRDAAALWKDALLADGLNPATVNAKLSALNGLLRFLGWQDCRVKFLRLQHRAFRDASRDLGRDDYQRLQDAAQSAGRDRLALLLEAICATGVRVSEVRFITVEAAKRGRADVALKGKIRTILLPGKLCRKLLKRTFLCTLGFLRLFPSAGHRRVFFCGLFFSFFLFHVQIRRQKVNSVPSQSQGERTAKWPIPGKN